MKMSTTLLAAALVTTVLLGAQSVSADAPGQEFQPTGLQRCVMGVEWRGVSDSDELSARVSHILDRLTDDRDCDEWDPVFGAILATFGDGLIREDHIDARYITPFPLTFQEAMLSEEIHEDRCNIEFFFVEDVGPIIWTVADFATFREDLLARCVFLAVGFSHGLPLSELADADETQLLQLLSQID